MSDFLLDTNVLSEFRKGDRCDPGVRDWMQGAPNEMLFVSVVGLGEIRQGIERIRRRDREQARVLEKWLKDLKAGFADRILPVNEPVADQWGRLGSQQPGPALATILAATALVFGLVVVTRDEDGFRNTGVAMVNPFSKPKTTKP